MHHTFSGVLFTLVPLAASVAIVLFRLDIPLFAPRPRLRQPVRTFCTPEDNGEPVFTDPDGRDATR